MLQFLPQAFLAYLSTKCSERAIVIATCTLSYVRHSSCVVNFLACVHSRGHILSPIIKKLGWNICLDEISNVSELDYVRSKTRSLGQISEKLYVHSRGYIFSPIVMKLGQNVCLDEISDRFENGSYWVKTRSLVQILEKHCVCSRSHIFSLIIMKLGQNVCLGEISDVFENGSGQVKN